MAVQFPAPGWAASTNIYEVNIRQYTPEGTFKAFGQQLQRLQKMGVETLWLMPVHPISKAQRQGSLGSYYACSDYFAVNPEFGTAAELKQLITDAHALGMKVLIDVVANHTGYDHVWTKAHPTFYKTNSKGEFYDSNGWVDVIDLDYTQKGLRKAMIKVLEYWRDEFEVDGFRCDMAHLVPLDFWKEARAVVDEKKPLFWLAETEDATYHQVFDCSFTWKFLHAIEDLYKGHKALPNLVDLLEDYASGFPAEAMRLYFLSNHDENSHSGSEYERLGAAVRAFTILCFTGYNSIPLLYSGQELPNKHRLLFFEKDTIAWTGQNMMEDFYSTLLHLRKRNSALHAGEDNQWVWVETTDHVHAVLAYVRTNHQDAVIVLLNLSPNPRLKFRLKDLVETGRFRSIWSGLVLDIDEETSFELQPWEYLVYEKV